MSRRTGEPEDPADRHLVPMTVTFLFDAAFADLFDVMDRGAWHRRRRARILDDTVELSYRRDGFERRTALRAPAAGLHWYMTLFGRDGLWAGPDSDGFRDAEPGKIRHLRQRVDVGSWLAEEGLLRPGPGRRGRGGDDAGVKPGPPAGERDRRRPAAR